MQQARPLKCLITSKSLFRHERKSPISAKTQLLPLKSICKVKAHNSENTWKSVCAVLLQRSDESGNEKENRNLLYRCSLVTIRTTKTTFSESVLQNNDGLLFFALIIWVGDLTSEQSQQDTFPKLSEMAVDLLCFPAYPLMWSGHSLRRHQTGFQTCPQHATCILRAKLEFVKAQRWNTSVLQSTIPLSYK
jgi:hypothetical protein